MATVVSDIVTGINTQIALELPNWRPVAYLEDIEKNSFRTQTDRYGVRALGAIEEVTVVKRLTFDHTFEVVLTKGYAQSNIDDSEQVQAGLDLRAIMLDLYVRLTDTKAGTPGSVLNVKNLSMSAVEYLDESKVAVLRSTLDITYRLNLS